MENNEIWLPVKGHESTHEVSNLGGLRSKQIIYGKLRIKNDCVAVVVATW